MHAWVNGLPCIATCQYVHVHLYCSGLTCRQCGWDTIQTTVYMYSYMHMHLVPVPIPHVHVKLMIYVVSYTRTFITHRSSATVLVTTTARTPYDTTTNKGANTPETPVPDPIDKTSGYHSLSTSATGKSEKLPKVKPAKNTFPDGTPLSSHMPTSEKDGFLHQPLQSSSIPTSTPAEPEKTKYLHDDTDEQAGFFKQQGTTLLSPYIVFKALEGPDPGGGEDCSCVDSFEMQLDDNVTLESTTTTVQPHQAE